MSLNYAAFSSIFLILHVLDKKLFPLKIVALFSVMVTGGEEDIEKFLISINKLKPPLQRSQEERSSIKCFKRKLEAEMTKMKLLSLNILATLSTLGFLNVT